MRYATKEHVEMNLRYRAHNYDFHSIVLVRGRGVYLWDNDGNKYIDCLSTYSVANQGNRHPKVEAAARRQIGLLTSNPGSFLNEHIGPFCKQLAELCGKDKVLLKNSGAEAVEAAIKLVRKWGYVRKRVPRGRAKIITIKTSFHGRTYGSLSAMTHYRKNFGPFLGGFVHVPFGDIEAIKRKITPNTVAVMLEPIQGEGGILVPPPGYLRAVRKLCTENNILMVADEVQTGLGRTGKMFCCDHEKVIPDLYILAKALGGGYLISAVVCNNNIMDMIKPGDDGSTFAGNPLACAAGRAALQIIVDEKLPERAAEMGAYFRKGLEEIRSPYIKEIRGKGLLIGVEIKTKFGNAIPFVKKFLAERIITNVTHESTIRFAPPLTITKEELDIVLKRARKVFTEAI